MSILALQAVTGASSDRIAALVDLHQRAFPAHLQSADPARYFAEALGDERNLNILMRDGTGTVIGYLLGIPQSQVFEELRRWDPRMRDDPERLYLDIIQVSPEQRGKSHALRLFQAVCAEAERRGYFKLSMHARTTNGINLYLQRIFAEIRFLRRIENWFGFGEPFDYMEATTVLRNPAFADAR
jgi:ribosomal protein S18 acetylase RimI-like enzyme